MTYLTLWPDSACQTCMRPSVEPLKTNWESGLKDASSGIFLSLRWPCLDFKNLTQAINASLPISN